MRIKRIKNQGLDEKHSSASAKVMATREPLWLRIEVERSD